MTKLKLIVLSVLLLAMHDGCLSEKIRNNANQGRQISNTQESTVDREELANQIALGVLNLSQQLTAKVLSSSTNKFEVISPISIGSALQLAFLGARGKTFDELKNLMSYGNYTSKDIHEEFTNIIRDLKMNGENSKRKTVGWRKKADEHYHFLSVRHQGKDVNYDQHKIEVANGIFVQNDISIRKEYADVVRKLYGSHIETLNFKSEPGKASRVINDWVDQNTHGKITEIVPPVMNPNTKIVLANALYFNAEWQQTFIEAATGQRPFFPDGKDGDSIMVEMMAQGGNFPHFHEPELKVDILGIPYKQNCSTMYIIIPSESTKERLKDVQAKLTADKIDSLIEQMTVKTAIILFPKMHLKSGYYLKSDLQDLGVTSLFEENESDLSLISSENCALIKDGCSHRVMFPENPFKSREKRNVSYKVASDNPNSPYPLTMKDFLNRKRIIKNNYKKKSKRSKREVRRGGGSALERLEALRSQELDNPYIYADDVIHKVDLKINEKGTEGGAATAVTLNRSGSNVIFRAEVPFMFIVRHDPTKIPLFYGVVFEPPTANNKTNSEQ